MWQIVLTFNALNVLNALHASATLIFMWQKYYPYGLEKKTNLLTFSEPPS